jgi:cytidylate kinase
LTKILVVAIDGPAGSGKSTVAGNIAGKLGLPHIDTGSIYRALTYKALNKAIPPDDEQTLSELAEETIFDLHEGRILVDGEDLGPYIRGGAVTVVVSQVSAHPSVRKRLVQIQRAIVGSSGAVVEGRDIGTVVLPDADVKIFLTASPAERARRRTEELRADGLDVEFEQILRSITERDELDSRRPISPLEPAADAVMIDSTDRSADEVTETILKLIDSKVGG